MSSKTTEKPTGPCAACQKDGASRRCIPCRDVGIDIFFCNRDCQSKLWKQHKWVCGVNSSVDEIIEGFSTKNESKSTKKEIRYGVHNKRMCHNCFQSGEDVGHRMSICSKCNSVQYCSRECQVAHWPKHKEVCNHASQLQEQWDKTWTTTEHRYRHLFDQWLDKCSRVVALSIINCLGKKKVREHQPPRNIVHLNVEFSYNSNTFLLIEEPRLVPLTSFSLDEQHIHDEAYNRAKTMTKGKCDYVHFAFILCKELGEKYKRCAPLMITEELLRGYEATGMHALHISCSHIELKSPLFEGWGDIMMNNMQSQINHLKELPVYVGFVQNALKLFCGKARHGKHGIMINIKMGKEIGQIAEFLKYEDMPMSKIDKLFGKLQTFDSNRSETVSNLHATHLQAKNTTVLICFIDSEKSDGLFFDMVTCTWNKSENRPAETYKRNADYCFKQLQDSVRKIPLELLEKVSL
ncbi:hypothetical protein CTEN210_08831 [Chaetoceros tenuissimus]|uniref:MYND-type domain-containing protein n=1 Tax=Chaetoceros tenuissimus TaxID=426638 RepID=A0AAD3H6M4_9STRA|nr:hypothetical protein CTEN210_08831 [Chaetoceros tenuissimus]